MIFNPIEHLYRILHRFEVIKDKETSSSITLSQLLFKVFLAIECLIFHMYIGQNQCGIVVSHIALR